VQSTANAVISKAQKRLVFTPPFSESDFFPGEFIYDPLAPWSMLRSGMLARRSDGFHVIYAPRKPNEQAETANLSSHGAPFGLNVLVDATRRGNAQFDAGPWRAIARLVTFILRDEKNHQIRLDTLIERLRATKGLEQDLIEDTLRMLATSGHSRVVVLKNSVEYRLGDSMVGHYERQAYLRSFAHDLVANSQRIDALIGHSGTVGSYREDLLRTMLRKLLPKRYSVDTGFIEDSPRQLDIIIWDAFNYPALFREGDVVVIPRAAVRGVIEVKTTLSSTSILEAFDILHDAFQRHPSLVPVFKGVFAFGTNYKTDRSAAKRIKDLYRLTDKFGFDKYWHKSFYSGLTAICVPDQNFIMQAYDANLPNDKFPQPCLVGLRTEEPGDWRTAKFLQILLEHLDQETQAKRVSVEAFRRNTFDLNHEKLCNLFDDDWHVGHVVGGFSGILSAVGARTYLNKLQMFFAGGIDTGDIVEGFQDAHLVPSFDASRTGTA
jgi:hypothetical protein